jgi:hypothetical protein
MTPLTTEINMSTLPEMILEDAAKQAAGNWQRFDSFVWFRDSETDDSDAWTIIYTHNRDSGLLDESNADAIAKALERFTEGDDPDVVFESHDHWACGHVDGFSIRVYRNCEITDVFRTYHDLMERLDGYPILDEEDYSERELEATLENIGDSAWKLKHEFNLPHGWESEVYSWLSENRQRAVENRDDRGGYPEEDDLRAAFNALGYEPVED